MENQNNRLQETRRKEIPETIKKYKSLIDGIFEEVAKPFPVFKDREIKKEDEVVSCISAEEQLYNFMLMREKAIDHADRMLNKINELELELNAPDLFQSLKNDLPITEIKKEPIRKNFTKQFANKPSQ